MESNYPVDPKTLNDKGTKGVMSSVAGLGFLGVEALLGIPVVGTVISAGLIGLGAIGLLGKTKTDKISGTVLGVAGIAGLTTLFLPGVAHSLLSLGGIGLLGYGLFNLAGFIRGLKKEEMNNYHIETYGCEMNKAESAAMEATLREHGWKQSEEREAQLILLNTCTVRATAENRVWNRIHQLTARKKEHDFVLVVIGCMAEQYKNAIKKKAPGVDYIIGTYQRQSFSLMLDSIANGQKIEVLEENPIYIFSEDHHETGAFRSFIPIIHGCNNFCTYCIVPYVRGREISRSPLDILREIDKLEDLGVREIILLGQNVNSYTWEKDGVSLDFPGLIKMIAAHLRKKQESEGTIECYNASPKKSKHGIGWIRFITSHPKDLSKELMAVMGEDPFFCHHLHLPLQSGSNTILSAMNRKYTREYYLSVIDALRNAIPDLTLSTDIMVGFPGETEEDFEQTLDLMRSVRFSYAFMYHFNERNGTFAAGMPNKITEKIKKERLARVIALQKEITSSLMRERIGHVDEVLIEDRSKRSTRELLARTSRDEMVVFPGSATRIGQFAQVRFISVVGNTLRGEEV